VPCVARTFHRFARTGQSNNDSHSRTSRIRRRCLMSWLRQTCTHRRYRCRHCAASIGRRVHATAVYQYRRATSGGVSAPQKVMVKSANPRRFMQSSTTSFQQRTSPAVPLAQQTWITITEAGLIVLPNTSAGPCPR
jgi:hypothetical protein